MPKPSWVWGGTLLFALVTAPTAAPAGEALGAAEGGTALSMEQGAAIEAPSEAPPVRPLPVRPLSSPALGTGAPGLLSEMRCPERALSPPLVTSPAYSSGAYSLGAPTLGIGPGTGSALYGQTFGENYGAGPGSVTEQSNAILGRNCETLSGE